MHGGVSGGGGGGGYKKDPLEVGKNKTGMINDGGHYYVDNPHVIGPRHRLNKHSLVLRPTTYMRQGGNPTPVYSLLGRQSMERAGGRDYSATSSNQRGGLDACLSGRPTCCNLCVY